MNDKYLKWLPLVILFAGIISSTTAAQLQIASNDQRISDIESNTDQKIEDVKKDVELLQADKEQQIRIDERTKQMTKDLDEIKQLLKGMKL